MEVSPRQTARLMNGPRLIERINAMNDTKNRHPAAPPAPSPAAEETNRLQHPSAFQVAEPLTERAKCIQQLRGDAHKMDADAASLRILGNHTRADAATDFARSLRAAANHLEATEG